MTVTVTADNTGLLAGVITVSLVVAMAGVVVAFICLPKGLQHG